MPPITDPWFLSLAALFLLSLTSRQKTRTWAAIAIGSVLAWFLPPVSVAGYLVLDTLSAALVLRKPAGLTQRAIGLLFAIMILVHAGFAISDQRGWSLYYSLQEAVGWLQLSCLFAWGAYDGLVALLRRASGRQVHSRARV